MSSASGLLFAPPLGGLLPSPLVWEMGFLLVPHHTCTGIAGPAGGHQPCGCPLFLCAFSSCLQEAPRCAILRFPLDAVLPSRSSAGWQQPGLQGAKRSRKLRVRSDKQFVKESSSQVGSPDRNWECTGLITSPTTQPELLKRWNMVKEVGEMVKKRCDDGRCKYPPPFGEDSGWRPKYSGTVTSCFLEPRGTS